MEPAVRKLNVIVGLALLGCVVTGIIALIATLLALVRAEFLGAGVCLAAAGLSFGLCGIALAKS